MEKLARQRPSCEVHLHCHVLVSLSSGWISALVVLKANTAVAVLMLLVALFFTGIAVLGIVMLKRVRGCVKGGARRMRSCVPRGLGGTFGRSGGRARLMGGSELMAL